MYSFGIVFGLNNFCEIVAIIKLRMKLVIEDATDAPTCSTLVIKILFEMSEQ